MGGIGSSHNKIDSMTEIETKIMSNLFESCLSNYKDAWESITEIEHPVVNGKLRNDRFQDDVRDAQVDNPADVSYLRVQRNDNDRLIRRYHLHKLRIHFKIGHFRLDFRDGFPRKINPTIAYTMMDRVMGGIGSSHNKIDSMTEIETKIMSNLFESCLSNYKDAWESIHLHKLRIHFKIGHFRLDFRDGFPRIFIIREAAFK